MKKAFLVVVLIISILLSIDAQVRKSSTGYSSTLLTSWMDFHCQIVRSAKEVAHVAYSRHFSYTAVAAYESVVGSKNDYQTLAGQLNDLNSLPSHSKHNLYWPASLNAAYAEMLRQFYSSFGSCKKRIDSMENVQKQSFSNQGIKSEIIGKSSEYGKGIAAAVIQWAQGDAYQITKQYVPQETKGAWKPTPPSFASAAEPYWSQKRSFTRGLLDVFELKQPVYSADPSSDFYKMVKEVYVVSQKLTSEERAIALYWDDAPDGRYMTVFGHWTSILSGLIKAKKLSLIEAAEAFAKMTIAMHEAAILAWKGKYQYNVPRPVTYIQEHFDKDWAPLIITPNHPEFPAAHATLSNAAAFALCTVFGESCAVTDNSYVDIGMKERTFPSLQATAKEAGFSRLYGGIHYRYSIEQGFLLGEAAAKHVLGTIRFQPSATGQKQKNAS